MICSMGEGGKDKREARSPEREIWAMQRLFGKFILELGGVSLAYTAGSDYNSATSGIMAKNSVPSALPPRESGDMQMPQMMGLSLPNLAPK